MAIDPINVGLTANDGTGDDLREAFIKVNQNFDDVDVRLQTLTSVTGRNLVEASGFNVFTEKQDNELLFRSFQVDPSFPGTMSLRLSEDGNTIYVASTQATYRITDGTFTVSSSVEQVLTFAGTGATDVTVTPGTRTITFDSLLSRETAPTLTATLDANNNAIDNVSRLNEISASELSKVFSFDFGAIGTNVNSVIEWIVSTSDVDLGAVDPEPNLPDIDLGAIVV
jgi:hypothetical protein